MIKSKILIFIKWMKIYLYGLAVFAIIYNTYFGWNLKALSDSEKYCDDLLSIGMTIYFIMCLIVIVNYIEFQMRKEIVCFKKNYLI